MENKESTNDENKKKSKVWVAIEWLNYIVTAFFAVGSILLMSKVMRMKVLPTRYVVIAIVVMVLLLVINILLRKKKAANVVFIILLSLM